MMHQQLVTSRIARRLRRIMAYLAIFSLFSLTAQSVLAATILTPRIYMNSQKSNQVTGQVFEVFLKEASGKTGTNNEIRIMFPDGDDGEWCRSAGTLTPLGITDPLGATESATELIDGGSWAASCVVGSGTGAAEANSDRLIITGVGALGATTRYGVRLTGLVGVLGTATPSANSIKVTINTYEDSTTLEDTGLLAISTIDNDQVVVTAVVDPTLTVAVSANTASLGTLSASNVNQIGITSTVSTNADGGFVSLVKYDVTLTAPGPFTIPAETGGGTIAPGTSEYGASTNDADNVDLATTSNSCATGTGTYNATALSTTFKTFASEVDAVASDVTTLCFSAAVSASQAPGTYTSTATLVTTARF